MAGRKIDDDDWDEDEEAFDPENEADDDEDTMPCPYCHRPIYEDAQRCPYCENYVVEVDAEPGRKPWWVVVGVLLCLVMVVLWIISGW